MSSENNSQNSINQIKYIMSIKRDNSYKIEINPKKKINIKI